HAPDRCRRKFAPALENHLSALRRKGLRLGILADDARVIRKREVVQDALQLILEDATLLLDDENRVEASGELVNEFGIERPDHADLADANADLLLALFVEIEAGQRLHHVLERLACRQD